MDTLDTLAELAQADPALFVATPYRVTELGG
jgi:hypothetical protein